MLRMAGEVADGIHVHPAHSMRYIQEVVLPSIREGAATSGRDPSDVAIVCPVMIIIGETEEELVAARDATQQQVAFYGSTRTYAKIFETHGWDDTPPKLHEKMAKGDMAGMAEEITDEMVDTFAITGKPDDAADEIKRRYGSRADRVYFYNIFATPLREEGAQRELIAALSS